MQNSCNGDTHSDVRPKSALANNNRNNSCYVETFPRGIKCRFWIIFKMEYCDSRERMAKTKRRVLRVCSARCLKDTLFILKGSDRELTHMNDGNLNIMVIPNIILH